MNFMGKTEKTNIHSRIFFLGREVGVQKHIQTPHYDTHNILSDFESLNLTKIDLELRFIIF